MQVELPQELKELKEVIGGKMQTKKIKSLYGELLFTKRCGTTTLDLTSEEIDFLKNLLEEKLEQNDRNRNEKYNIKYKELTLTGNLPRCPQYLYEYSLPGDFGDVLELYRGEELVEGYKVYIDDSGNLVIATNATPLVLGYRPKGV